MLNLPCQLVCLFTCQLKNPSLLTITIILPVGDDEMVEKIDAQSFAGALNGLREAIVLRAGCGVVAGVIVAERNDSGRIEQSLSQEDAHVDGRLGDTAVGEKQGFDEFVVAVE